MSNSKSHAMELFTKLLEWVWLPLAGMCLHLYTQIARVDKHHAVLTTRVDNQKESRDEDQKRNSEDHAEIKKMISDANDALDDHNKRVMGEFSDLRKELHDHMLK